MAVVSDHGEEFLEHGHVKHCRTLFDTEARVPLALRAPWLAGGRRAAAPVQNLDLAPTLLEALAMAPGQRGFEGRSLAALMRGAGTRPGHVFAAQGPLRSVTDGRLKLIHDLRAGRFWLYDRETDRGETRDLLAAAPPGLRPLRRELSSWLSRGGGRAVAHARRRGRDGGAAALAGLSAVSAGGGSGRADAGVQRTPKRAGRQRSRRNSSSWRLRRHCGHWPISARTCSRRATR